MAIYQNITQLIGKTPLLRLERLGSFYGCHAELYAKCEFLNPSGSIKDRSVMGILQERIRTGTVTAKTTVLCLSGGNGGVSAAMACAAIGLSCVVIATDNITLSDLRHIRAYGAKVLMTPAKEGLEGVQNRAWQMARANDHTFILDQFEDEGNPQSHKDTTGPEIYADLPDIDVLVAGIGTGGTLTGCAEYIKMMRNDCLIVGVEPYDSPVVSGGLPGNHSLTGIGLSFVPKVLNRYIIDRITRVRTPDALTMAQQLAALEGLLCGPSSGAALTAALSLARDPDNRGKKIVVILPDRGEEYLSRGLYDRE